MGRQGNPTDTCCTCTYHYPSHVILAPMWRHCSSSCRKDELDNIINKEQFIYTVYSFCIIDKHEYAYKKKPSRKEKKSVYLKINKMLLAHHFDNLKYVHTKPLCTKLFVHTH